tara:strand:+ start:828 stop:1241 length:414 start_codon:yes stop_codon:yes gene_type:complete
MSLTGKLGRYQSRVANPSLSAIDIKKYERIFKVYTEPNNGKEFYFYNILRKVEFPTEIQSNFLSAFSPQSRMPLTTVSFNLYQDIDSWWLIYLLNKDVIGKQFYVEGGQQLKYILPEFRDVIYDQITNITVYDNRHF